MTTAGRTVAFSAATVAAALVTLTVFPLNFLKSMGIAGVVTAGAALVISPALLRIWGTKLRRGRGEAAIDDGRWARLSRAVMRRPGAVAVVTAAAMLLVAAPALRVAWSPVESSVIPRGDSSRTVADVVDRDLGRTGDAPVTIAISSGDRAAVSAYRARVAALPGVRSAGRVLRLDARTSTLQVAVAGDADGPTARRLVGEIRGLRSPLTTYVGGPAATSPSSSGTGD